jgi:hypothetical protein
MGSPQSIFGGPTPEPPLSPFRIPNDITTSQPTQSSTAIQDEDDLTFLRNLREEYEHVPQRVQEHQQHQQGPKAIYDHNEYLRLQAELYQELDGR